MLPLYTCNQSGSPIFYFIPFLHYHPGSTLEYIFLTGCQEPEPYNEFAWLDWSRDVDSTSDEGLE